MKILIESTSKVVSLSSNGSSVPARVWEGYTESGIPIRCFITRIAVHEGEDMAQLEAELLPQREPSRDVAALPLRLIL